MTPDPFGHLHVGEHGLHVPDPERVKWAHSLMTVRSFEAGAYPNGHRAYAQGADECCYLCALLIEIDALKAERDELRARLASTP